MVFFDLIHKSLIPQKFMANMGDMTDIASKVPWNLNQKVLFIILPFFICFLSDEDETPILIKLHCSARYHLLMYKKYCIVSNSSSIFQSVLFDKIIYINNELMYYSLIIVLL